MGSDIGSRDSGRPPPEGRHHNFGKMAAAGAAGLGLAEFFKRRRSRSRDKNRFYDDSHGSYTEDKYSDDEPRHSGWRKKLLRIGAVVAGIALIKKFLDRRRNKESDMESGRYRPAHTRSDSLTEESLSRVDDGQRPEPSYRNPRNRPPSRPPSRSQSPGSSYYYYNSAYLTEDDDGKSHGVRNAFLGAGALAAVKRIFSRRGGDNEQRHVEEMRRRDREDERLARANSKRRNTGGYDGPYRRAASYTATDMSSTDVTPRPPRGPSYGESGLTGEPTASGAVPHSGMPPVPPAHHDIVSDMTGRHPSGHDTAELGAGAAGAAGAAMGEYAHRPRSSSRHREQVDSPPVSVKVKMHNDGRHVTLRRLTDEEAAAGRESRRRDRRSSRRRSRAGSASSLSGNEDGSHDRWRRVEELERQQAEQVQREQEAAAAAAAANHSFAQSGSYPPSSFVPQSHIQQPQPPPPPHPPPSSLPYGAGSITSPGTGTFTGTDASGDYANNRRRRRAERARARQDRQQHGVEFT